MDVDRVIAAARSRFLEAGEEAPGLRPEILTSWRRCSSWSVPEAPAPRYLPTINSEHRLVRAARPVLDQVAERLGELTCAFLIADPEGAILDRRVCDRRLTGKLDAFSAIPGFLFSEDAVGTNGIGTTVELGRPFRVDGGEHYAEQYHQITCVGVPIFDRIGRELVGVLDIACPSDPGNQFINLLAEQTARTIEDRLLEERSRSERALLDKFLAARRGNAGVVVISDRLLMTDPQAARYLHGVEQPLMWERAARALGHSSYVEEELPASDGGTVSARMVALHDGSDEIGVMMQIRRKTATPGPVSHPGAGPGRAAIPAGLAGTNSAFADACRQCRNALEDGEVLVVSGETGVGKLAILTALHAELELGSLVVHDLGEWVAEDPPRWLAWCRAQLSTGPGLLVLRHANQLPETAADALSTLVGLGMKHGWQVALTFTSRAQSDGSLLPTIAGVRVGVPPLRNRLEDIGPLVNAFGGSKWVAPEVTQLLMRLSWPGNLRELRSVVERTVSAGNTATVGLSSVPADVRQAALRQPLTRFERAEVHAILEALAECDGNKKDAAVLLGISRSTLYRKLQTAGIDLDNTIY